jgi:hypothetical protein
LGPGRRQVLLGALAVGWVAGAWSQAFDHGHAAWDALLRTHVRWLPDSTQSRVDHAAVVAVFKWFREDFEKDHQGFDKLEDVFAKYAVQLSADTAVQEQLRARRLSPVFLDYDWSLNDVGR